MEMNSHAAVMLPRLKIMPGMSRNRPVFAATVAVAIADPRIICAGSLPLSAVPGDRPLT